MGKLKKIMIIFLIGLIITPFVYVQINKIIYTKRVNTYLVGEQDYKKTEIESVKGKWGFKLPPFYTVVVFKDEPFVEYIYFAHNRILQGDYITTEEGKRKQVTGSDIKYLKHYDPPK